MLTKDQATYNLTKAYLERLVYNRLFWDNADTAELPEYYEKTTRFETMRKAYIDCGIMTYTEAQAATESKYILSKVE